MGRTASKIDVEEVKRKYSELGNIKLLSKYFHTSTVRMINILESNGITKNGIGNKISLTDKQVDSMISDYVNYDMQLSDIAVKYNICRKKVSDILKENGVKVKRRAIRVNFIKKAMFVHKGEGLDYSKVEYINNRTPVCIIDPVYGEFWQTPSNHLKGQCHPLRKNEKISSSKRMTTEEYVKRAEEVHKGEGLDYSKVEYKGMHKNICIIDPVYGEYWQEASAHLKGCGHKERGIKKCANSNRYTNEEFKELCHKVHPDYILDKVNYKSSKTKVCVICPKHGEFNAYPDGLLQGKGCPKCGHHLSHCENDLYEYVCSLIGKNNVVNGDKTILDGKEIDVYVPSLKIGFEFDGLRWHSEIFGKGRYYHLEKTESALSKGVRLIHIFEDEWNKRNEIVKSKISRILGVFKGTKISARKCSVTKIDKTTAREFLENNHIQGFSPSTVYLGCYFVDSLVGVMTFVKREEEWELNRFATDNSMICRGVGGKMLTWFINEYNPLVIKSFLDRRWCFSTDGNLYEKIGFTLEDTLKPEYSYSDFKERFHKFGFRKQTLHKKYGFPLTMTETEMTKELGYVKVWDCGLYKYVWKNK